jgi:hypothetical protein
MAVRIPEMGGTPLAMEIPRHNGKATRKTKNPADKSDFQAELAIRFSRKGKRRGVLATGKHN